MGGWVVCVGGMEFTADFDNDTWISRNDASCSMEEPRRNYGKICLYS
jgi:hypothetical protein